MKPNPKITRHNIFIVACKMFYLTLKYRGFLVVFSKEHLHVHVDYDTKNIRTRVPKGSFLFTQNSKVDIDYTEEE